MNSRPWLAVAVYARAPAADAPMATDMAANSDSTLTNSHGASAPDFTISDSPSTRCGWGEIGYAQITSGRHSATVSATAREPSICLSMGGLRDERVGGLGGPCVALGRRGGEPLADRLGDRGERDRSGERGERSEEGGVGERPAQVLAGQLGGRDHRDARVEAGQPEVGGAA